jgi:hypothetical protein
MSVMALLLINNVVDAFEYMRFTRVLVQKHVTMHVLGSRTQTFRTSVLEIELMFTITLLLMPLLLLSLWVPRTALYGCN